MDQGLHLVTRFDESTTNGHYLGGPPGGSLGQQLLVQLACTIYCEAGALIVTFAILTDDLGYVRQVLVGINKEEVNSFLGFDSKFFGHG